MTINRSYWVLALPLALALVASPAVAGQGKKQTKPAAIAPLKVDSPNMATSISDWHSELGTAPARTAPALGCTCGKNNTQTATTARTDTPKSTAAPVGRTVTQTATNSGPTGQRGNRGKRSAKPLERAREVPLSSLRP